MSPRGEALDLVELRVPAEPTFVSTVRLTAASLGALCDLTVNDIEDLRLVVDEACSMLLRHAVQGGTLRLRFELTPGCLQAEADVVTQSSADIERSGFAWTVLQALATTVDADVSDGHARVRLTKRRTVPQQ